MYIIVNHLEFTRPVDELRLSLEQEGLPILASQHGFIDFYFVKNSEDRATVIILWKDELCAVNGANVFGPAWFAKNLAPYLAGEQEDIGGEVIVWYQERG